MTGVRPSPRNRTSNRSAKPKRLRQNQPAPPRSTRVPQGRSRAGRSGNTPARPEVKALPPLTLNAAARSVPGSSVQEPVRRPPSSSRRPGPSHDPLGLILLRATVLAITLALLVGGLSRLLQPNTSETPISPRPLSATTPPPSPLSLTQESRALKAQLTPWLEQEGLTPHLLMVDLDSGTYVGERSTQPISAASTIKIPILVAFLQAVDAGQVELDEILTLKPELIATGSGTLQTQPVGTQISALQAATLMITISDNTATNLLIDRLGGLEAVDRQFRQWGLANTSLSALLPDLEGNNTTAAVDIVSLLGQIEAGQWLNRRSRDRFLDILWRTENRALLPQGLGDEARIAHKTGDIQSVLGDAGIIDLPSGQRYILAVLVERQTPNDPRAQQQIQQISGMIYRFWSEPALNSEEPTGSPMPGR